MSRRLIGVIGILLGLLSCSKEPARTSLKVAATSVPQAQILEFTKPRLQEQGIDLIVVTMDNYNLPNRALAEGKVDANFFQHEPFLDEEIALHKYPIESIGRIEIEPMGIYSQKIRSLSHLKNDSTIAIPSDPTNQGRALLLLQEEKLIQLRDQRNLKSTVKDIVVNPKRLKFITREAHLLSKELPNVDLAVINTNFALEAGLSPTQDTLALESKDDSPYANVLVVRIGDQKRPEIQALLREMTSDRMRRFIVMKYKGALIPAFY